MKLPPWHPYPDVWLLFGSNIAFYLIACRRHLRETGEATPARKQRLFVLGVAVLWLGADWPIHDLAERYLYSIHMVQHMLFSLVAAPILIAGMPPWLLRYLLRNDRARGVFRVMTKPLVALVVFNGVLLFTHWPAVVQASIGSSWMHFGLHTLLTFSALAMWWPVMSPLPELPPLSAPAQMMYLFFQSLAPTIPASFLTFGDHPLYPIYATFPRIWGIDALTDQLIAGLTMKLIGGAILWCFIGVAFFRWHRQEEGTGWDALRFGQLGKDITSEARV